MNKRAVLELTPLLDIILIMLFAVIITVYQGNLDTEKTKIELKEKLQKEQIQYEIQSNKLEEFKNSIYELLKTDEEKFNDLIQNLDETEDSNKLIEEIHKYSIISKQISFIDIGLQGENNRLFINDKKLNIYIPYEEIETLEKRNKKLDEIINIINESISSRTNNDILMITIDILDKDVYKYAYDLVKESTDKVIKEYGEDKVLRGEFLYNY